MIPRHGGTVLIIFSRTPSASSQCRLFNHAPKREHFRVPAAGRQGSRILLRVRCQCRDRAYKSRHFPRGKWCFNCLRNSDSNVNRSNWDVIIVINFVNCCVYAVISCFVLRLGSSFKSMCDYVIEPYSKCKQWNRFFTDVRLRNICITKPKILFRKKKLFHVWRSFQKNVFICIQACMYLTTKR